MKIKVFSPDGLSLDAEAESVRLSASDGSIGIRTGCADMIISLKEGELYLKNGADETRVMLSGGFAQVHKDTVNIFAKRI